MKVEGRKKVAIGVSLAVMIGSSLDIAYESNKDSKAMMNKLDELDAQIQEQQEFQRHLEDEIDQIRQKVDTQAKKQDIMDSEIKDKLSYRERVSSAIQQSSNYVNKKKADDLADIVDSVTSEFQDKYGFPKDVPKLLAIMQTESDFRNLSPNEAEAVGYIQITPQCLNEVNKRTGWGYTMADMQDATSNIRVGWYYLNRDRVKYGDEKSIVAYNQGYRNLGGAVQASRGDSGSYLSKVMNRTVKFNEMIGDAK